MRGPVSETKRGPPSADTVLVVGGTELRGTLVGAAVELATEVVDVTFEVFVDVGAGRFEWPLLLHAAKISTAAVIAKPANRGRRTQRS